ncbi:MAG: hypothetical protein C4523_01620 [Myxococcales bacterium]|nr:MAG: hypothetical protein C4523_01620 [Myxococcales bacterium]
MGRTLNVFISAGETSGDRLGSTLIADLQKLAHAEDERIEWRGMGGPAMRAYAATLFPTEQAAAAGLAELLPRAASVLRAYRRLAALAGERRYEVAVLIDFPDFNLRLAPILKRRGTPILYYGAPQLWAWRPGRVEALRRRIDRLAALFPFEAEWFSTRGIDTVFVGHPAAALPWREKAANGPPWRIGLWPGSRRHEVETILPRQLAATRLLNTRSPGRFSFAIHVAPGCEAPIAALQNRAETSWPLADETTVDDMAWTAAGTAATELACRGAPFILTHAVHPLSFALARRLVSVRHLAMPNLMAGRTVAPELVQGAFTPEALARETLRLADFPGLVKRQRETWREVRRALAAPPGAPSAAELAWNLARP